MFSVTELTLLGELSKHNIYRLRDVHAAVLHVKCGCMTLAHGCRIT